MKPGRPPGFSFASGNGLRKLMAMRGRARTRYRCLAKCCALVHALRPPAEKISVCILQSYPYLTVWKRYSSVYMKVIDASCAYFEGEVRKNSYLYDFSGNTVTKLLLCSSCESALKVDEKVPEGSFATDSCVQCRKQQKYHEEKTGMLNKNTKLKILSQLSNKAFVLHARVWKGKYEKTRIYMPVWEG